MQLSTRRTVALTVMVVLALAVAASAGVIYSGIIDVAATKPHYAVTNWILETTLERSVERRARKLTPPAAYHATGDTAHHFGEMCGLCHGAPGKDASEIGKGLRPKPPELAKVADQMSEAEIFWVAKNGIRMTGMPAFGETHSDRELWNMVSFVKSLSDMSPEEYRLAAESH